MRENLTSASDDRTFSFYLGYYLHIVTDAAWVKNVYRAQRRAFRDLFESDAAFNASVKAEWDALDFRFLRQSGAPRLLAALTSAEEVPPIDCPFIRHDALKAQFARAVQKYSTPYPADVPIHYLNPQELDEFVINLANCLLAGTWQAWHERIDALQPPSSFQTLGGRA